MNHIYYEVFKLLINRYKSLEHIWNLEYEEFCKCDFLDKNIVDELCDKSIRKKKKIKIQKIKT